jgi:hypothetical protein
MASLAHIFMYSRLKYTRDVYRSKNYLFRKFVPTKTCEYARKFNFGLKLKNHGKVLQTLVHSQCEVTAKITNNVPVFYGAVRNGFERCNEIRDFQGLPLPMPRVMMLHPSNPLSISAIKTTGTLVVLCTRVMLCVRGVGRSPCSCVLCEGDGGCSVV